MTKLKNAYNNYIEAAVKIIQQEERWGKPLPKGKCALSHWTTPVRYNAEQAEEHPTFEKLVRATCEEVKGEYKPSVISLIRNSVGRYFRRSRFYQKAYNLESIHEYNYESYLEALQKNKTRVTYIAPLEHVEFCFQRMQFEGFELRDYSLSELQELLDADVREAFYTGTNIDYEFFAHYTFIVVHETVDAIPIGHFSLNFSYEVKMQFSNFPKQVDRAILQLAMYNWEPDRYHKSSRQQQHDPLTEFWSRFNIPFVIKIDDDPFQCLRPIPHTSQLDSVPFIDNQTGEELGEVPPKYFSIMPDEKDIFESCIRQYDQLINSLEPLPEQWHFFEVACGYFMKAFFADGLEQLLWHITTLEALLGGKGEDLTERLAQKICIILADTERQRKEQKKYFKEIYSFRSDIVHGNKFEKKIYQGHLKRARILARDIIVWFLNYLAITKKIYSESEDSKELPDRSQLLLFIDLDVFDREHLHKMINNIPSDFPRTNTWFDRRD